MDRNQWPECVGICTYLILFLPFFAGGFLYLGSSDLLPEAHEENPPLVTIVFTLLRFLLIFIITRLLGV